MFGEYVVCEIKPIMMPKRLICIGVPTYAVNDEVVVVADEFHVGMSIGVQWIRKTGVIDTARAEFFRKKFDGEYPGFLKEK